MASKNILDKTVSLRLNKFLEWIEEGDENNLKKGCSGRLKAQQNLHDLKKLQSSIELETKANKNLKSKPVHGNKIFLPINILLSTER